MATASPRNASVTKTSFVRGYLGDHPKAGFRAVNQAWNEAGHDGSISETLVHRMRAKLGLTGNLRPTRPSSKASASKPSATPSSASKSSATPTAAPSAAATPPAATPPRNEPTSGASASKPKARRGRPRKTSAETASKPTPAPSPAATRPSKVTPNASPAVSLEAEFDRLLFQIIDQGMPEVEEAIRTARRLFVLHQGR